MKHRKLRIAWTVAWGVMALLLIALWVRSYRFITSFEVQDQQTLITLSLESGGVFSGGVSFATLRPRTTWNFSDKPHKSLRSLWLPHAIWNDPEFGYGIVTPFWLIATVAVSLAISPWLTSWSKRFSLRTLLIATTLVAVGLGLIVWLTR